jgi:hypothetical protein
MPNVTQFFNNRITEHIIMTRLTGKDPIIENCSFRAYFVQSPDTTESPVFLKIFRAARWAAALRLLRARLPSAARKTFAVQRVKG